MKNFILEKSSCFCSRLEMFILKIIFSVIALKFEMLLHTVSNSHKSKIQAIISTTNTDI